MLRLVIIAGNFDVEATDTFAVFFVPFAWALCIRRFDRAAWTIPSIVLQFFFEILQEFFIGVFDGLVSNG